MDEQARRPGLAVGDAMDEQALIDRIVADVMARLGETAGSSATVPATSPVDLAPLIDHTLLRPEATPDQIDRLCDEAIRYRFAAACVQPVHAARAVDRLAGHDEIAVASVVGFPHGAALAATKRAEAEALLALGVDELDMVLPIGLLKARQWSAVADHVEAVVAAAHERASRRRPGPALVKVIIEAALLTDEEKVIACAIAETCRADFVKTSTGFAEGGATVEDVRLMRRAVGDRLGVKAAGGIRTREQAVALLAAGATRLGTSAGPALVEGDARSIPH